MKRHWITICQNLYICPICKSSSNSKDEICKNCNTPMYSQQEEHEDALKHTPVCDVFKASIPTNY